MIVTCQRAATEANRSSSWPPIYDSFIIIKHDNNTEQKQTKTQIRQTETVTTETDTDMDIGQV